MFIDTKSFNQSAEKLEQIRTLPLEIDKINGLINGLKEINLVIQGYGNCINSLSSGLQHTSELGTEYNALFEKVVTRLSTMETTINVMFENMDLLGKRLDSYAGTLDSLNKYLNIHEQRFGLVEERLKRQ